MLSVRKPTGRDSLSGRDRGTIYNLVSRQIYHSATNRIKEVQWKEAKIQTMSGWTLEEQNVKVEHYLTDV